MRLLSHPAATILFNSLLLLGVLHYTCQLNATSAMSLLDLANELLQCISENLESEREINAFAQANRRLYGLLNSYVYRYNVQCSASSALVWTAQHGQEATARRLLAEGASIEATGKYDRTPLL